MEYTLTLAHQVTLNYLSYSLSLNGDCSCPANATAPEVAVESLDGRIKQSATPFRTGIEVVDLFGSKQPAGTYRETFLMASKLSCQAETTLSLEGY